MHEFEAKKLGEALRTTSGSLRRAAELLEMPHSTLATLLQRKHPELLDKARALRAKNGNELGRPRDNKPEHSKRVVLAAWKKNGNVLSATARALDIPPSTLRDLLIRYGVPMKKKKAG